MQKPAWNIPAGFCQYIIYEIVMNAISSATQGRLSIHTIITP